MRPRKRFIAISTLLLTLPLAAIAAQGPWRAPPRADYSDHDNPEPNRWPAVAVKDVRPMLLAQSGSSIQPSEAQQVWEAIQDTTSVAVLEDFIRRFGFSPFSVPARVRLSKLKQDQAAATFPMAAPSGAASPVRPAAGTFPTSRAATPLSASQESSLKPKNIFRECDVCPEMVVAPAGSFTMGSPESEPHRRASEGPQHGVTFSQPFAVGRFAVTFDEWDSCVADGGCNGYRPPDQDWGRGRRPVINVSWNDAVAYVSWLAHKTGKPYRLLSEAEREYVTRAGTTTPFWWGSFISTGQANYDGNYTSGSSPKGEYRARTMLIDSFQPNPFGLYQVHGNVWEWTADCWNDGYRNAPTDGSAWTAGDCDRRVRRGGSWGNYMENLRAANRDRFPTGGRDYDGGFRLGRTLTP